MVWIFHVSLPIGQKGKVGGGSADVDHKGRY